MNYKVSGADLTSVADAIRTKGGTSADLEFPDGFVTAIGNISGGGSATLVTKSISANGTYDASDDNADGYSHVTVAVPSTNRLVSGSFTPASADKGSAINVTIPYSGSGYPVSMVIYPKAGANKSGTPIYSSTQQYAVIMFALAKADTSATPDYTDNVEKNQASVIVLYKNSTSDPTASSSAKSPSARAYNASGASSQHTNNARFKDATTLSIYVADTSYGFLDGTEYTYDIVYSS